MGHCEEVLRRCAEACLTVLLIGYHGVGKTMMVLQEAARRHLRLKYYSASTLDPWTDLVGVPVPEKVSGTGQDSPGWFLRFVRPEDLLLAEIVFFDELNRSHPKIQNAVLEMIQFRTINGVPLPKLKMVWAAINPPNDIYHVTELDPALLDRFQVHLCVPAEPSVAFYRNKAGLPMGVAQALVNWWRFDLDDDLRRAISPRRLEYMGRNFVNGIELRHSLPPSTKAPLPNLARRLSGKNSLPFELTRETLVTHQVEIISEMKSNADVMLAVHERLECWPDVVARCVPLFLALTSENQLAILKNTAVKVALLNLARQGRNGNGDLRQLADRLLAVGIMR
jgi:hypothetical protein